MKVIMVLAEASVNLNREPRLTNYTPRLPQ
jgi:hypothetical protein